MDQTVRLNPYSVKYIITTKYPVKSMLWMPVREPFVRPFSSWWHFGGALELSCAAGLRISLPLLARQAPLGEAGPDTVKFGLSVWSTVLRQARRRLAYLLAKRRLESFAGCSRFCSPLFIEDFFRLLAKRTAIFGNQWVRRSSHCLSTRNRLEHVIHSPHER